MPYKTLSGVLVGGLLSAGAALAQNEPPPRKDPKQDPVAERPYKSDTTGMKSHGDAVLAAWLLADNENEVALARLAQERSKNEEVKAFAKQMIDDHQKIITKLQGMAAAARPMAGGDRPKGAPVDAPGDRPTGDKPGDKPADKADRPADASGVREPGMGGPFNVVQLKNELAQKCLATARRELEQKSGAEFDKCFMGMQIGAHMAAVDTIEVFRNHATGDLKQALSECLPTVKSHLEHAKTIGKKLESGAAETPKGTGNPGK
jgi:predicted outer membrane protein